VACSLRSEPFFDHDFSNQKDGYTTSENTLVEKSYFSTIVIVRYRKLNFFYQELISIK